ncbi:MAG: serine/threonine-protein phosphatase [Opitutae bacterium]|nr:serine/threonine-protein phosphatase [Opitutae bacterium]
MTLRSFAHTDIGRVRPENEDSFLCDDAWHFYAVADGIGGLPGGAQASQMAIHTLEEWLARQAKGGPLDYTTGLVEINERVFQLGRRLSPRYGIGTTLTAAHFHSGKLTVIHVGDSSLYRLRGGELDVLTVEHNLENEMRERLARGESALLLTENRAALTRCVGQPPPLVGDIHTHAVEPGDRYLLCSDGVSRFILPREIAQVLGEAKATPETIVRTLIERANERGGLDNSTAVVIFS